MNYNDPIIGGGGSGIGVGAPTITTVPHVLELIGVSHSGPIVPNNNRPPSIWSNMTNRTPSGLILKDVSFEVNDLNLT